MSNQELRDAGLKVTTPRVKILDVFAKAPQHHLSAEDVYRILFEAGHDVGLATVYRVLTQFEQAGLVKRHNFEGGHAVFELDSGEHHDHLVCGECGTVVEFFDTLIEEQQKEVAKKYGFNIAYHSLIIYGCCSICQK